MIAIFNERDIEKIVKKYICDHPDYAGMKVVSEEWGVIRKMYQGECDLRSLTFHLEPITDQDKEELTATISAIINLLHETRQRIDPKLRGDTGVDNG